MVEDEESSRNKEREMGEGTMERQNTLTLSKKPWENRKHFGNHK